MNGIDDESRASFSDRKLIDCDNGMALSEAARLAISSHPLFGKGKEHGMQAGRGEKDFRHVVHINEPVLVDQPAGRDDAAGGKTSDRDVLHEFLRFKMQRLFQIDGYGREILRDDFLVPLFIRVRQDLDEPCAF